MKAGELGSPIVVRVLNFRREGRVNNAEAGLPSAGRDRLQAVAMQIVPTGVAGLQEQPGSERAAAAGGRSYRTCVRSRNPSGGLLPSPAL